MNACYVPGYLAVKAALTLAGLLLAGAGCGELAGPAAALLAGRRTPATVVQVTARRASAPPAVFTDGQVVPGDQSREVIFRYLVTWEEERSAAGSGGYAPRHAALLNVASVVEPSYRVGDQVLVALPPTGGNRLAYAVGDLRTWVPGGLLAGFGLVFAAACGYLLRHARRPVALPADLAGEPEASP